jgi:Flp pilus assembly secretin CpaC
MMSHSKKWTWRSLTTRLLIAPVMAGSVASAAVAQSTPTGTPAAKVAKSTDPKDLLKQGREALKAGQFDRAMDLAREADRANPSGRWGLFGDTPESLEKDVQTARAEANGAEAKKLTVAAKELFAKPTRTSLERLQNLDKAYAMADRAVTLSPAPGFFDDLFGGERPEAVKKEIDTARLQLRKTLPASELAKVSPVQQAGAKTAGGIQQAGATVPARTGTPTAAANSSKPTIPAPTMPTASKPVVPATMVANSPTKIQATQLMAEARQLKKSNQLGEARAKAMEAQKLGVTFAATEDSPQALLQEIVTDGKTQIDKLVTQADLWASQKETSKAEMALKIAVRMSGELGFQTSPLESKLAAISKTNTPAVAAAPVAPAVNVPASPASNAMVVPALPGTTPAPTVPTLPSVPAPSTVASTQGTLPALPSIGGVTPGITAPTLPTTPATMPATVASNSQELLAQARKELTRGDLEQATKMAMQAHSDPAAKADAQALIREIEAEGLVRKKKDAAASFTSAAEYFMNKQYDQALSVLKLVDPSLLPADMKAKYEPLVASCDIEVAKIKKTGTTAVATVAGSDQTPKTAGATPPSALGEQVRAMGEVEFQKLRSEGLEAEARARDAFNRGETDLAIQTLTDFTTRVKSSTLSASRQSLLISSAERRLEGFRLMKRQMDFYAKEAKDKRDARDMVYGKALADQQKKEEIAKKVREVSELSKSRKHVEAEMLALQLKNLDPEDPALTALYEIAKRQRRVEEYSRNKDTKESFFLQGLNDAEKPGVYLDVENPIHVNQNRTLNAMRRGDGSDAYMKRLSSTEREIENRLNVPITVEFKDKPFREMLDMLRKETKLNISVDDQSISEDAFINLEQISITEKLDNISLRNALTILLDKARLKYVVESDVIRITTEKKARGRMYTKVFSVMELVTPIPDFALAPHQSLAKALAPPAPAWQPNGLGQTVYQPRNGLTNGEMVSGQMPANFNPGMAGNLDNRTAQVSPLSSSATLAASPRQNESQKLMKLITGLVRPYSWQALGGPGDLQYYDIGGALVVNQTADVIREVQDLLEALRRLQETSVAVEIRVISLSESFFERVGVDFAMNIKTKNTANFERSLTTGQFRPEPFINDINARNVTVGWNPSAGGFTNDLDVPIRPNTFGQSIPTFGGYPGIGNGGLGVGLAFLNDVQVFMFMEAAQGDRRVNVMQAPKVTLFNGQTSTVFVSDVSFFTTGLQVINVGGQFVYLPQNTPFPIGQSPPLPGGGSQPGISVTVQAIVSSDRRFVRLNLTPNLTSLTSAIVPLFPVTAFITPVFEGGSQGVPIPFTQFFQQPSFSDISVQTTVSVPDGGTAVLGGLKTLSEGRNESGPPVLSNLPYINRLFRNQGIGRETRHIMIMVTPRIIIQSEEEYNQTGNATATPAIGS